jgi:hypothetical protein
VGSAATLSKGEGVSVDSLIGVTRRERGTLALSGFTEPVLNVTEGAFMQSGAREIVCSNVSFVAIVKI